MLLQETRRSMLTTQVRVEHALNIFGAYHVFFIESNG